MAATLRKHRKPFEKLVLWVRFIKFELLDGPSHLRVRCCHVNKTCTTNNHHCKQATFDVAYSLSLNAKRISPENFQAFAGVLRKAFERLQDAIASTQLANAQTRQSISPRSADAFKM